MANIFTGASKGASPWATSVAGGGGPAAWQPGMDFSGLGGNAMRKNPALQQGMQQAWGGASPTGQYDLFASNPALFGNSRFATPAGINAPWINSGAYSNIDASGQTAPGGGLAPLTPGVPNTSYNGYTSSFNPTNAAPGAAPAPAGGDPNAGFTDVAIPGTPSGPSAQGASGGAMLPKSGTIGSLMGGTPQVAGNPASDMTIKSPTGYDLGVGAFLDPSMKFTMDQGLRALGSSAAAGGQTFSGNTLKDIMNYSQGLAGTNFNNAVNQAGQQQQFNYGVDTGNRNFGYQAALNDQTIPFDQQMRLAQMGLTGTQSAGDMQKLLATLISSNTGTLGQILGSGTIGSNNAITGGLSQAISAMLGNQMMNRFLPPAPG